MHQAFTRIEAGDQNYYLLTNLFEGGKNGLDLTVCNGEQVWRETGKVITRQDKTRQDNALFGVLYSPMYIDFIQIIYMYSAL